MEKMSRNFRLEEFFYTQPDTEKLFRIIERIKTKLVIPILQPLRDFLGEIIIVTSGFRDPEYNHLVGGAEHSHHLYEADRCAVDITTAKIEEAWLWLKAHCGLFCYAYWDKRKKFIHISGITSTDRRIGQMWIKEE
jgi:uncharacterized protein YcbK (DUF882 family)